jgi:putative ABC transport system permease protein
MLFAAASVVLLVIVCANVSGLFLARAAGRRREFATRLALGASRARLIRHSLVEALLISALGGALGMVWARALTSVLGRLLLTAAPPETDSRTVAFLWFLIFATTATVGLAPALQVVRAIALGWLTNRAAQTGWRRVSWQHGLVVAQLSLCLTALVVAGLCLRSGARLAAVDTGIDDDRTREIALRMALGASRSDTVGLVVRDAMRLVGFAFVPGLLSAFAAGRLLRNMLYESAATDLPTAAVAAAALTTAALIAAWRPARWAAKVDPIVALREE